MIAVDRLMLRRWGRQPRGNRQCSHTSAPAERGRTSQASAAVYRSTVPCIGFTPFGSIEENESLARHGKGNVYFYSSGTVSQARENIPSIKGVLAVSLLAA